MSDIETRAVYLLESVNEVLREHSLWERSEDQSIHHQSAFAKSLAAMFSAFALGDIPERCRPTERIISQLEPLWNEYTASQEATGHNLPPQNTFWTMFQQLLVTARDLQEPEFPLLPPPRFYAEREGLSAAQIAKIYDWKDWRGVPDANRVLKELANPSPEFAEGVPDPRLAARQVQQQAQQRRMEQAIERHQERLKALESIAPEPIEDLVLQGVSAAQICRMKKMTYQQLEEYCQEHALDLPSLAEPRRSESGTQPANLDAQSEYEGEESDESPPAFETDSLGDPQSLEEQVIAAAEEDPSMTTRELAELFDVNWQKITAILKRREHIASASS